MSTTITPEDAADVVAYAGYRYMWPTWVRQTLITAAKTEDFIPQYAKRRVTKAMRIASAIEARQHNLAERAEAELTLHRRF